MTAVQTSTRPTHRILKTLCGVAIGATVALSATAAYADAAEPTPGASSTSVGGLQAKCDAAIAVRMTRLGQLDSRLAAAGNVTSGHRGGLESIITSTEANLTTLKSQIDAATTIAELRPLCDSIVVDNRVFVLRSPQVDVTIRLDNSAARVTQLQVDASALQHKIDDLKAAGKDTSKAEADLAKMNSYIAAAEAAESGQADGLIALTPAGYNANHNVVAPFTGAARKADTAELRAAYWGARTAAAIARIK